MRHFYVTIFLLLIQLAEVNAQSFERVYASYFGGTTGEDEPSPKCLVVDDEGNYYISGSTKSTDLPTSLNSYQQNFSGSNHTDAFIARFNNDNTLAWCTYFGGANSNEKISKLVVTQDALYFCGETGSPFMHGTAGSHQEDIAGNTDGFVGSFNLIGEINWLTLFGGAATDGIESISVYNNKLSCIGATSSTNLFVTEDAIQPELSGNFNAFVSTFSLEGQIQYSSYWGGNSFDAGMDLSYDSDGNLYLLGRTNSTEGIATENAAQLSLGGSLDSFVARLNSTYQKIWCTYLGGNGEDYLDDLMIDNNGNLWINGQTWSTNMEVSANALTSTNNSLNSFLINFDSNGNRLWGSYFGSNNEAGINSLTISNESIVLLGYTAANFSLPVTANAQQPNSLGNSDAFILMLNEDYAIAYCSYYGSTGYESFSAAASDDNYQLIALGNSTSIGFATPDAYETIMPLGVDAYIAIFDMATAVSEIENDISVHAFPSPANSTLNIQSKIELNQISLIALSGKTVFVKSLSPTKKAAIDIATISDGLYLLKAETELGTYTTKVVIE